jgi:hypothetical protein
MTAAMNTNDLESDAVVLLRLARAWLSRDVISVHIDATGIAITVATEDAAQRIIEAHGLRRAASSSLVKMWAGVIGDAPVSVRIEDTPIPMQRDGAA